MQNAKLKIKGFTMIELLIVIAVLGILAVAVLSSINPIEQINRGRDTASRSDAEQLLSAIDRYNAARGLWPWQDITTDPAGVAWTNISITKPAGTSCPMVKNLSADPSDQVCPGTDEVKASFTARITGTTNNTLYMEYAGTTGTSVYICFNPQSGSFKKESDSRCTGGALPADFPATACGSCPALSLGKNTNCVCLP